MSDTPHETPSPDAGNIHPADAAPAPTPAQTDQPAQTPAPAPAPEAQQATPDQAPAIPQEAALPPELAAAPVGSLASHETPEVPDLPTVTHHEPNLTFGASDAATGGAVTRLVKLLAAAGPAFATNSIVKGENPHAIVDNSVMADVRRYCAEHEVSEPEDIYENRDVAAADLLGAWVGPYIWQHLYDNLGK